jgi:hypothetical protein
MIYNGFILHDIRRTSLQNLVRAGVPERVAVKITGDKTRTVFDRYDITSERDVKNARDKLERYLAKQNGASSVQINAPATVKQALTL